MDSETSIVNYLPTELVQCILQYLPVVELMRSRRVCKAWRDAADSLTSRVKYWSWQQARAKCSPDLTWRQLYKSLHLWTKVETSKETKCTKIFEEGRYFRNIHAFMGGIIEHDENKILYYNVDGEITGGFDLLNSALSYTETECLIVYLFENNQTKIRYIKDSSSLVMRIIKKINGQPDIDGKIDIPGVSFFIVNGQDVYYKLGWDDNIFYVSKAQNDYKTAMSETFDCTEISLGVFNGNLCVYLENGKTYHLIDNMFVDVTDPSLSIFEIAIKYNLLVLGSPDFIREKISNQLGTWIYSYCFYGNITIFGYNGGVIRIYNSTELINNPQRCRPLLEFNLSKVSNQNYTWDLKANIDVIEKENGHIILVCLNYDTFTIELTH